MPEHIVLRDIRANNLRIGRLNLEQGRLHVFCGPSGSGKSTLALDVLYAEADRLGRARGVSQVFRRSAPQGAVTGLPATVIGIEQQLPKRAMVESIGWHLGLPQAVTPPETLCPLCAGRGFFHAVDPERVLCDPKKPLTQGAFSPCVKAAAHLDVTLWRTWCARLEGVRPDQPWEDLPEYLRQEVLHGRPEKRTPPFHGILPALEAAHAKPMPKSLAEEMAYYAVNMRCPACGGAGLAGDGATARALRRPLEAQDWPPHADRWMRLLGLERLQPADPMYGLSSSTARKLRFFALIRDLSDPALIIFDEPAAGLTETEAEGIGSLLEQLRDEGHTVIAVEHRDAVARRADVVTVFGPGSGADGGEVVLQGAYEDYRRWEGARRHAGGRADPSAMRPARATSGKASKEWRLRAHFSQWYGFDGLDIDIPLGKLVCVTGPGGSGKTAYVNAAFAACDKRPTAWQGRLNLLARSGQDHVRRPYMVDASPIGVTPASTPATFTGLWDKVRGLFAALPESRRLGQTKSHFSFNTKAGQCPACQGRGWLPLAEDGSRFEECPKCKASRFAAGSLRARYAGKTIADVNALTASEADRLFQNENSLRAPLRRFSQVALGYLVIGQPSNTLSGGENLRVKLVDLLSRRLGSRTLYVMDNPCRGIGAAAIPLLAAALRQLTASHTVLVAENEPAFLPYADWLISLGEPRGGKLVVLGQGPAPAP